MAKIFPSIPLLNVEEQDPVTGLVSEGTYEGVPPVVANVFSLECEITDINGSGTYTNSGTVAVPVWTLLGSTATLANGKIFVGNASNVSAAVTPTGDVTISNAGVTAIGNDKVTAAMLAPAIEPTHVVKFAGKITWSGGLASLATAISGVLATDIVQATIETAPSEAGYLVSAAPTADTLTLTLSAANTTNDAVIAYTIFRAIA